MQKEPLLLSSANTRTSPVKSGGKSDTLTSIIVGVCILFALVGFLDVTLRLFAHKKLSEVGIPVRANETTHLETTQPTRTLPVFVPSRLTIDSIGVSADIEAVGVNERGEMKAPSSFSVVSWYKLGAKGGEEGHTVIAGHFNSPTLGSGVFERLSQVTIGDTVVIEGGGTQITYEVTGMQTYKTEKAPTEEIFSLQGAHKLILITCDGAWDAGIRRFDERLVVTAVPLH